MTECRSRKKGFNIASVSRKPTKTKVSHLNKILKQPLGLQHLNVTAAQDLNLLYSHANRKSRRSYSTCPRHDDATTIDATSTTSPIQHKDSCLEKDAQGRAFFSDHLKYSTLNLSGCPQGGIFSRTWATDFNFDVLQTWVLEIWGLRANSLPLAKKTMPNATQFFGPEC